ncbi:phage baseplate assembly protein V [Geodermatophilus sp. CPCC 205506]|uniref:phage baseplate assembly protein V n=1 Tax=Geodermatophilus sp. CPCC 205506 TaxID=2936596 RepID=UPI003F52ECB2
MIGAGAALERVVADLVERVERRFYGKYRGFVVDNEDPARLGRLRVRVPSLLGNDVVTGWAAPCLPYGGAAGEGFLFLPAPEAGVWVEFEEGDLEFPVWVGTFWSRPGDSSQLPRPTAPDGEEAGEVQDPPTRKILTTACGHTLQFEDADGEESVLLHDGVNGHLVVLDGDGLSIVDGVNGHEIRLSSSGVRITDGVSEGNTVELAAGGITLADKNQNRIVMGAGGIQLGDGAAQALVLGTQLATQVGTFLTALNAHTHVGNLGAPTSPPATPMQLSVPLSAKHKVQ